MTAVSNPNSATGIFLVLCLNNWGGAELSMLGIARGLHRRGFAVSIIVYGRCVDLLKDEAGGPEIIRLAAGRTLRMALPLFRLLRQRRPDVLISALTHTNIVSCLTAILAGRRTKVIVTEHGLKTIDPDVLTGINRLVLPGLTRMVYPLADQIVAVSKGLAGFIKTLFKPGALRYLSVIYNPVVPVPPPPPGRAPHLWLLPGQPPVVIGVGRLDRDKNFTLLMRAFALLSPHRPLRLMILGEGDDRARLEATARELGIEDKVLLPGFQDNVRDWLSYAAVFVSSSFFEGFGNAIVEAMSCGLPVISTDCPYGPREILDNGQFGTLLKSMSPEEMAWEIDETLNSPVDKEKLRICSTLYGEPQCINDYAALIERLCESRK